MVIRSALGVCLFLGPLCLAMSRRSFCETGDVVTPMGWFPDVSSEHGENTNGIPASWDPAVGDPWGLGLDHRQFQLGSWWASGISGPLFFFKRLHLLSFQCSWNIRSRNQFVAISIWSVVRWCFIHSGFSTFLSFLSGGIDSHYFRYWFYITDYIHLYPPTSIFCRYLILVLERIIHF